MDGEFERHAVPQGAKRQCARGLKVVEDQPAGAPFGLGRMTPDQPLRLGTTG